MSAMFSLSLLACNGGNSITVPGTDVTDGASDGPIIVDTDDPTDVEPDALAEVGGVDGALVADYPTVIRVQWAQSEPGTAYVEFGFDGEPLRTSPPRDLDDGAHEELILGVPYDADVQWRVVVDNDAGQTTSDQQFIRTGPTPSEMPVGIVELADPLGWDQDMEYVFVGVSEGTGISSRTWTMLVDRSGRVVWGHRSPINRGTMHPRVSWYGDSFLIDHSSFWVAFDGGDASTIHELKIDGTEVQQWATPGQHHPFTDMPDGSLAWAQYQGNFGTDDAIMIHRPDGSVEELFVCEDWADAVGEGGYCGSNTLSYDENRDVFLFSLFTYDTVVEVDATSGQPVRWFGDSPGSYSFAPANSQFDYQHGSIYTDQGTLLVSTHSSASTSELAIREYMVDEASETLVEVWNFGVGLGVFGTQMGEAHRLPGGNSLHNYGTNAVLREATPSGDVVWDIRWEEDQYGSANGHSVLRSAPVTSSLWAFAPDRP